MNFRHPRYRELIITMLLLSVATALALSPDAYLPMLARAFMLQWAMMFLGIASFAMIRRRWWMTMGAFFGALVVAMQVDVPFQRAPSAGMGPSIRVAHMNVFQPNIRHDAIIRRALASDADVISVQEVSPEWAEVLLAGLGDRYPYAHIEPRTDCYGIALFSRVPLERVRTMTFAGSPFVEAFVRLDDQEIRVLAVHASSPTDYAHFRKRNAQLSALAGDILRSHAPTVVIGDLNTVHWDRAYAGFCKLSGLRPLAGAELRSWPAVGPIALIPLDHVLVSPELASNGMSTFSLPGSDHRGLLAELQFKTHAR